jgi:hypothetical protein
MDESSESAENAEEEGDWTEMGAELEKGFLDYEDE